MLIVLDREKLSPKNTIYILKNMEEKQTSNKKQKAVNNKKQQTKSKKRTAKKRKSTFVTKKITKNLTEEEVKKILLERKIKRDWAQLKKTKMFENLKEFRKLYQEKPEGMCLRKYPSYEWCEENFFFGTEKELIDWYKTTDEIPFYTKYYTDRQHGHLTIIGFRRDKSRNNKLITICKCDCGKTVEYDFRKIRHGDNKSCGCRSNENIKN